MRSLGRIGRVAVLVAVVGVIVVVGFALFGGGSGYTVRAEFINASQLVEGNLVQIAGSAVGSVKTIEISEDGQAVVTLSVSEEHAPLREGTTAEIGLYSLSGQANRFVDLTLAPGPDGDHPEIPAGGTIGTERTDEPVELDSVFNILDPVARVAVQEFFKQSAEQFRGMGPEANRGFQYLNPALSASSNVFRELNRDERVLEAFILDSERLVSTLAERRNDLAGLVANLNQTTGALGAEKEALAESIARLPDFMRAANTTFVNLRSTLDTVDPLVDATEPVVSRAGSGNDLQELLPELRAFAADAEPAVADLDELVRDPGAQDDLIDLQETFPELASAALDEQRRTVNPAAVPHTGTRQAVEGRRRDVGEVPGAFAEIVEATRDAAPIIAFGRPYTPELFGWFDDFSHPGGYDAVGAINRSEVIFNESSLRTFYSDPALNNPGAGDTAIAQAGNPQIGEFKKCPGGAEVPAGDGSNIFSTGEQEDLDCKEADRQAGNYTSGTPDPEGSTRIGPGASGPPTR